MKHLCRTCLYDFPTCEATGIQFFSDKHPTCTGKDADAVIHCESYSYIDSITYISLFGITSKLLWRYHVPYSIRSLLDRR